MSDAAVSSGEDDLAREMWHLASSYEHGAIERELGILPNLRVLADSVLAAEEVLGLAVQVHRAAGASWANIGHRLGVSRQAVHERYGSRD